MPSVRFKILLALLSSLPINVIVIHFIETGGLTRLIYEGKATLILPWSFVCLANCLWFVLDTLGSKKLKGKSAIIAYGLAIFSYPLLKNQDIYLNIPTKQNICFIELILSSILTVETLLIFLGNFISVVWILQGTKALFKLWKQWMTKDEENTSCILATTLYLIFIISYIIFSYFAVFLFFCPYFLLVFA